MSKFISFKKIEPIYKLNCVITQKIHGTNGQVYIYEDENGDKELLCGSRNRWLSPAGDNYGFCSHVYEHKQEFIEKLGIGRHFGEWAGPGIGTHGEGLNCKNFYLFNHWDFMTAFREERLPSNTFVVPILSMENEFSFDLVNNIMNDLMKSGSRLHQAEGFKHPEGIAIQIGNQFFKKVFKPEETGWRAKKERVIREKPIYDFDHLLQPMRLEKLLSRDQKYIREYPESLVSIVRDYVKDLVEEGQCTEEEGKLVSRGVFGFVKSEISKKLCGVIGE